MAVVTCAGVPYSDERALTEGERTWLAARAESLRRRQIVFGIGTALIPALICVPLALSVTVPWAPILMLPVVWACLMIPLKWLDARKRWRFADLSARAERVEVFEGVPNVGALAEGSLSALIGAGLVLDGETPQRIDRIRASGEAIAVNGVAITSPTWTDDEASEEEIIVKNAAILSPIWTDVAEVAPAAFPAREFPERVSDLAFDAPDLDRRPLSDAELAELRALHPERESLRRNGCLLAFCAYFLLFAFAAQEDAAALKGAVLALKAVALAYFGWRAFLASRERKRLRRDLAEASVARVENDGVLLEVLPRLGLVWTVDGEPAPWRYGAQAKTRPPL